jgi:transcriptional regulator with XRE-family HTH domain
MSEKTKQNMAKRLNYLMGVTPGLDTLKKISARSGVGYGTVRRITTADDVDVSIGNVEAVAQAYGLTLIEFVSDFDEAKEMTSDERAMIADLRSLPAEDAQSYIKQIAKMAMLHKASQTVSQLKQSKTDLSQSG